MSESKSSKSGLESGLESEPGLKYYKSEYTWNDVVTMLYTWRRITSHDAHTMLNKKDGYCQLNVPAG